MKKVFLNLGDQPLANEFKKNKTKTFYNLKLSFDTKTKLATISLGSGPHADVLFSFIEDICGENEFQPRHTRKYCDIYRLNEEIQDTKIKALKDFSDDVKNSVFPSSGEIVEMEDKEYEKFLNFLD